MCIRDSYIIDLQKTVKKLDEAYNYVKEVAAEGGDILFVGTKKQAQESIRDEALRCGMHYVNARWLGGMLTNFRTIRKRIDRMDQLAKICLLYTSRVLQGDRHLCAHLLRWRHRPRLSYHSGFGHGR